LSNLIQPVSIFPIKASKKDNYQLENKEIKNLPPNLKKNPIVTEKTNEVKQNGFYCLKNRDLLMMLETF